MREAFVNLWNSRKVWVGGITTLLTILFNVLAHYTGMEPAESISCSAAIVGIGLAIIQGIASDNKAEAAAAAPNKEAGIKIKPSIWLLALLLLPLAMGCQASQNVREAQAWEGRTLQMHLANDLRIEQIWGTIFTDLRTAEITRVDQEAIDFVKGLLAAGKLTAPDLDISIKTIMEQHQKAIDGTNKVKAQMRTLSVANQGELEKAAKLHGKIAEWMDAGMDETAIPGMITEVTGIISGLTVPTKKAGP